MNVKYCKCGAKSVYSLEPPKFCAKCGKSLENDAPSKVAKRTDSHVSANRGRRYDNEVQDFEDEVDGFSAQLPTLDPASITFETPQLMTTFQSLAKGGGPQGRTMDFTSNRLAAMQREAEMLDRQGESDGGA